MHSKTYSFVRPLSWNFFNLFFSHIRRSLLLMKDLRKKLEDNYLTFITVAVVIVALIALIVLIITFFVKKVKNNPYIVKS